MRPPSSECDRKPTCKPFSDDNPPFPAFAQNSDNQKEGKLHSYLPDGQAANFVGLRGHGGSKRKDCDWRHRKLTLSWDRARLLLRLTLAAVPVPALVDSRMTRALHLSEQVCRDMHSAPRPGLTPCPPFCSCPGTDVALAPDRILAVGKRANPGLAMDDGDGPTGWFTLHGPRSPT